MSVGVLRLGGALTGSPQVTHDVKGAPGAGGAAGLAAGNGVTGAEGNTGHEGAAADVLEVTL
jgi:hypothetical protein